MTEKIKLIIKGESRSAEKSLDTISTKTDRVEKSFKGAGLAAAGFLASTLLIGKGAINSAASLEKLQASLLTVTGSTENATQAFDEIKSFAATTPFLLEEVTDSFIKLKALGLDPSEESLRSYGNTSSAMGKSLNQMIEAVADASTGEFERLKEFGIKAKSEGDNVSFTFQGVTTKIKKNADEIQRYLLDIGDVQFAGAMSVQMDTLGGKFSNLEDAVTRVSASFANSTGLSAVVKAAAGEVTDLINVIDKFFSRSEVQADALKNYNELLKPNVQLFNDLGISIDNLDPSNIDEINRALLAMKLRNIDLKQEAGLSFLQKDIKAAAMAYGGFVIALQATEAAGEGVAAEKIRAKMAELESRMDSTKNKYIDLVNTVSSEDAGDSPAVKAKADENAMLFDMEASHLNNLSALQRKSASEKAASEKQFTALKFNLASSALTSLGSLVASEGKKGFKQSQMFNKAEILMSTYVAAQNAYASASKFSPLAGIAAAAAATLAGAARFKQVANQKFGGDAAPVSSGTAGLTPVIPSLPAPAPVEQQGIKIFNITVPPLMSGDTIRPLIDELAVAFKDGYTAGIEVTVNVQ